MYQLGTTSKKRLEGVRPELRSLVEVAITRTPVDFTVVEGLRTLEQQREYVRRGSSTTMNSRHLTGHAVDLAPWIQGKIDWNTTSNFIQLAEVMRKVAVERGVEILWGGAWQLALNYFSSAQEAFNAYTSLRKSQGRRPFIDLPHYQLTWRKYP